MVSAEVHRPKCLRTCDYQTSPYCIALALTRARDGRMQNGFAFAGANAWRVNAIVSVQTLVDSLVREYAESARSAVLT